MTRDEINEVATEVKQIAALVDTVRPILAGQPSPIIGGALADLVATWIAGHVMEGDPLKTYNLRMRLLKHHREMVSGLVAINARRMGT